MKQVSLCGSSLFKSWCLYFLDRRKWLQGKKRVQVLKRLEQLSATAE